MVNRPDKNLTSTVLFINTVVNASSSWLMQKCQQPTHHFHLPPWKQEFSSGNTSQFYKRTASLPPASCLTTLHLLSDAFFFFTLKGVPVFLQVLICWREYRVWTSLEFLSVSVLALAFFFFSQAWELFLIHGWCVLSSQPI